jgi:hypothetical protein
MLHCSWWLHQTLRKKREEEKEEMEEDKGDRERRG